MQDVTRTLARFLVASRPQDVPPHVQHEAVRALLNWVGCAVGASGHETVVRAIAALAPCSGPPQATVLGRGERVDILQAALFNGIASHVLDFDDTHERAVHPSAPVYPAILALAEWRRMSGAALIHAFVLGVETEIRVGLSVFPEHYAVGWHITGTAGVFGAAAAAGTLLGLDETGMTHALGLAATQAAGLREMFGSMCKSLHPGHSAQAGLMAALLAQRGFTSSRRAIEAPRGFAQTTSTRFDPAVITDDLGARWELARNMYKPYACGLVVHAAIDGCIELVREHRLAPEAIEGIALRVNPLVLELTAKTDPRSGLEGKFSVYHACAIATLRGSANESEFSDDAVRDPQVVALRARVTAQADPAVGKLEAFVTMRLADGRVLERHVPHALGTVARPMSDADLEAKFLGLARDRLGEPAVDRLIERCWKVHSLEDAGELARAAARGA